MSNLKLKVCGLRDNAQAVIDTVRPDMAGFIYYNKSPRYVGDLDVSSISAKSKVGVFVNEDIEQVKSIISKDKLDMVQLHGTEAVAYCKALKSQVAVIKVFSGNDQINPKELEDYAEAIDFYLFDTRDENFGGTGKAFDWGNLKALKLKKPVILSGGIGLAEAKKVIELADLDIYAIDVNSRFEIKPGLKNLELLKDLKEQIQ